MFTSDGSYAQMWVRGDEPRANTEEDWTAEQLVTSYQELTANLGRVSMDGNEINFEAYMANSPTYMNGWPDNDQTATFEMHGDDRMTLTMASGREFLLRRPLGVLLASRGPGVERPRPRPAPGVNNRHIRGEIRDSNRSRCAAHPANTW
jgi:hypothetical protein